MSASPHSPLPLAAGASDASGAGRRAGSRLDALRSQPRQPGEASFFFYDAHFKSEAVKVLPGEYFVDGEDVLIMTTLGSCIAVCLWDRERRIGGMNHFMLPDAGGAGADGGRYGSCAMDALINTMLGRGASRHMLEAKVFGGGAVVGGINAINIGELNTSFALDYLKTERIPVVGRDVLDVYTRKVCFFPGSGKAMVKRLVGSGPQALAAQDRSAASKAVPLERSGGSIEPF